MKRSLVVLVCLPLAAAPLLAQVPAKPVTAQEAATADAPTAVAAVAQTLMLARQIATLGVEKAPSAATKKLSLETAEAYGPALAELAAAAATAGIAVPKSLDPTGRDSVDLLQSSFETQFEHEYLDIQIASHSKAAALVSAVPAAAVPQALAPVLAKVASLVGRSLEGFKDAKRKLPAM